ncbi:PAS domain S-box-containing protein [Pedobacter sp. UYP24]
MNRELDLYKKAAELANIGIWELTIKNNELFWDFITKKIFETPDNYQPLLHEALSLYVEGTKNDHIVNEISETILTGKSITSQFQIRTFKGNVKWVEINSQAEFVKEDCIRLVGTIQDITSNKKLIEDLELNHYKFLTAFDYAPIGMALVSPEGKWIKVNNSLCSILGYEREELMALTFQDLTHPEDLQTDLEHVSSLLNKQASTYSMQKRYFHKNGEIVWSDLTVAIVWNADDTPLYFISQIQDITDNTKQNERLKKERQRLNNVIETTRIGTWEWNFTQNKITSDERCFTILGYIKDEVEIAKTEVLHAQLHPDDVFMINERLEECFRQKTDYYQCEYRMRHKDGSWVWIKSNGKVIKWSADKKPLVMLGTREDISRRKQIEEVQLNTMNIISDQNKRLINFAHIVSHNLRSHAGNFQMLLELLQQEQDEKEKIHMLGLLTRNANNLSETIANLNEVVSFQLNDKKQTKSINIREQIRKTINGIQALVEKENAKFTILMQEDLNVNYNPAYLESILLNLFTNAIKYKHPNRQPDITVKGFVESDRIILEIADNGLGIDLNVHGKKLFGMYKTFHEHPDSRGIGLFITKNQIEALGGTISIESEVNVGTTFKLSLLN